MSAALTPLATVLKRIFAANAEIRVEDYQNGFAELWQTELQGNLFETTTLLISGTNPPPEAFSSLIPHEVNGRVDFSDHFTAYSWAAAFRLLNPKSSVKIIIIDLSIPQGPSADLLDLFSRNIAGVSAVVPGVICLTKPSLLDIMAALASESPRPLRIGQQAMLRGVIQQHLVPEPDKHHQLGNVVGSLMLTTQAGAPGLGKAALAGLLQSLQPATGFKVADVQYYAVDQKLRTSIARGVPVVLFDDMGALWKPFVQQWVPDNLLHVPRVDDASRTRLVQRLEALTSEPLKQRRLNASDFGVTDVKEGAPFVLLLDLRLFSPQQTNEESSFVGSLCQLAEKIRKAENLKWPAISETEVQEVFAAWADPQSDKPNYRKARSWLPRLISLIDPTLPIVTFSSTQDPEVLKEFRTCGNIVADFAKPVFRGILGEAEVWIGATHRSFEKAMRHTLRISSVQSKLRKVSEARSSVPEITGIAPRPAQVEIFIDESGRADQNRFAIGAVVLISGSAPFDHKAYRDDALNGFGPRGLWGLDDLGSFSHTNQFPPYDRQLLKGKEVETGVSGGTNFNNLLNATLSGVENLVQQQGATIFACSLLSNEPPNQAAFASDRHPFHRYRKMLTTLLDAILFHCDPVVQAIDRGATICIDSATTENPATMWRPRELATHFGAHIFKKLNFSPDDLIDLPAFANKLNHPTESVSTYLHNSLPQATRNLLAAFKSGNANQKPLKTALVQAMNELIKKTSFFDAQRFASVPLRPGTKKLIAQNPQNDDLRYLNKMLLEDAYPLEIPNDRVHCRTIAKSDVLPIVSSLLAKYGRENLASKVMRSRALPLLDFGSCKQGTLDYYFSPIPSPDQLYKPLPKPLHYLADWIAHFTCDPNDWNELSNIPMLKAWFETGFRQMDGDELSQHLRCQRKWVQGARLSAVRDCAKLLDTPDGVFALNPRLKVKASHWLSALSGQEIISLFHSEESD